MSVKENETLYHPAKKVNSAVWEFFGLRKKNDVLLDSAPVCRECGATVLAKGGNTSNMHAHLRHHHAEHFATVERVS